MIPIPESIIEVLRMENKLTLNELCSLVREATIKARQADVLQHVMSKGTNKPSLVWKWHSHVWSIDNTSDSILVAATLWKSRCLELLAMTAEERRNELSGQESEADADLLGKKSIDQGDIRGPRIAVTKALSTKLKKIIQKFADTDDKNSADVAMDCVRAVCEFVGVSEEVGKDGDTPHIRGGVIEVKEYFYGEQWHGASLVQAAKRLHISGINCGKVGTVWARVDGDALLLSYRFGTLRWEQEEIKATKVRNLRFVNGYYDLLGDWEELCGFIKEMNGVISYETISDDENEIDSDSSCT